MGASMKIIAKKCIIDIMYSEPLQEGDVYEAFHFYDIYYKITLSKHNINILFTAVKLNNYLYLYDYFYTVEEYRKIKIAQILDIK